ncbi:MAG: PAS domain S-box protein, partial [Desulfobacteraceae bacterium]|nr:PAS domain S-box protein [Desulfobacteraceae bacterium]
YRILVETAMDAIFITQEGIIKFLNQRTVDMLGYSKGALLEKSFHGLVHPDYREIILENHGSRVSKTTPGGSDSLKIITKNGDVLWGQLNRGFILWEDNPATLNYLRDITKEKEIQAKNLHAQKMEIIGNLAGGIAHDFNNILSGILGYSQLAKNNLDNPEKAGRHIDHVILAGQKAAEMVQQILTVSRQTKNEKCPVKISLVVKEAL